MTWVSASILISVVPMEIAGMPMVVTNVTARMGQYQLKNGVPKSNHFHSDASICSWSRQNTPFVLKANSQRIYTKKEEITEIFLDMYTYVYISQKLKGNFISFKNLLAPAAAARPKLTEYLVEVTQTPSYKQAKNVQKETGGCVTADLRHFHVTIQSTLISKSKKLRDDQLMRDGRNNDNNSNHNLNKIGTAPAAVKTIR